jgi:hypothetical protein
LPPKPHSESDVQVAPGVFPRKHVFGGQLTGLPGAHRFVAPVQFGSVPSMQQDSTPLQ